jgi:hypothetical protein
MADLRLLDANGMWFRPAHGVWHLLRQGEERAWCGRKRLHAYEHIKRPVTYPWPGFSCFACMDRRWQKGIA